MWSTRDLYEMKLYWLKLTNEKKDYKCVCVCIYNIYIYLALTHTCTHTHTHTRICIHREKERKKADKITYIEIRDEVKVVK